VAAEQTTVVATVEKVDAKKRLVTVKGPRGNTVDIEVKDPKKLKQVKVGDEVEITYTEALAISVESPKK
jgi:Cu/Ag efflux protein CusF